MPAPRRLVIDSRREWLIVAATFVLFVFYYLARADGIAATSPGGGWQTMTGPSLPPVWHFVAAGLALGVVPVLVARFGLKLRLRELGLGLGNWRQGLVWLAIGIPLAIVAGKVGSATPEMRFVYPLDPTMGPEPSRFIPYALLQTLYFGGWEVLFRGVLLFGLKDRLGVGPANALQTAISVTAHFGRPLTETLSAIPAGLVFGLVCLRCRSVWYVAIIHWVVGVSLDWFILTG